MYVILGIKKVHNKELTHVNYRENYEHTALSLHTLGDEVDQIGAKWDKSRIFQIKFQYTLSRRAKMY